MDCTIMEAHNQLEIQLQPEVQKQLLLDDLYCSVVCLKLVLVGLFSQIKVMSLDLLRIFVKIKVGNKLDTISLFHGLSYLTRRSFTDCEMFCFCWATTLGFAVCRN